METKELIDNLERCMRLGCRECPLITHSGCVNYLMREAKEKLEEIEKGKK